MLGPRLSRCTLPGNLLHHHLVLAVRKITQLSHSDSKIKEKQVTEDVSCQMFLIILFLVRLEMAEIASNKNYLLGIDCSKSDNALYLC